MSTEIPASKRGWTLRAAFAIAEMMAFYPLLRPMAFALDPERAHRLTLRALKWLPPGLPARKDPSLSIELAGLKFPNPVGLAAGFDKDAEIFAQMIGFGFGFVEVGTLTPRPQPGNDRPRLFRLAEDRAVINRMGFNNRGQADAIERLRKRKREGMIGVNIGVNKDSLDRNADYSAGIVAVTGVADYVTINISSPNTPGLRSLQDKPALDALLAMAAETRGAGPPLFLKVAPDLARKEVDDIVELVVKYRLDAIIIGNTTISRPMLRSSKRDEAGGLSGAPLKRLALERLRDFRSASGREVPLIAAGGIENGVDAFDRIRAGASLVQLYTALVYEGPGLAAKILGELRRLMKLEGFSKISEAIGTEAPQPSR